MLSNFPQVQITAVDIKDDYLQQLQKLIDARGLSSRVKLAIDDLTELKTEGPFDFILSVDVMEHIEDDRGVFRNFNRVLSSRGKVLVNTPSDLGGSDIKEDGDESFIGEHVRDGYNRSEIEEKLNTAGLTPIRTLYTYGKAGSFAWKLLIKYPMKMLGAWWGFLVVLPFYYVIAMPIGLLLNAVDVRVDNARGTGLLAVSGR
jgi:SAM-dependent methyltransferase